MSLVFAAIGLGISLGGIILGGFRFYLMSTMKDEIRDEIRTTVNGKVDRVTTEVAGVRSDVAELRQELHETGSQFGERLAGLEALRDHQLAQGGN